MTKNVNRKLLLVGLPESGKSSFLAALYYYVTSDIIDKAMSEYELSENSMYLQEICSKWMKCELIGRTVLLENTQNRDVTMHLENLKTGKKTTLYIPDLAGESFQNQFRERYWEKSYLDEFEASDGILLFIHPANLKAHVLIDDVHEALKMFAEDNSDEKSPFKIEEVPTQVVLVDILSYHAKFSKGRPLHVSVVVSAWDQILNSEERISPKKWIEVQLPLLFQYLNNNKNEFAWNVFGISAQGGEISDPVKASLLHEMDEPGERIIVQEGDNHHKNICAPIEWLLNQ